MTFSVILHAFQSTREVYEYYDILLFTALQNKVDFVAKEIKMTVAFLIH